MKMKSIVKTVGILGCATFLVSAPAVKAGEMIAPMDPIPIDTGFDNLLAPIETTFSAGYDTKYMFRGFDLGQEAVWTGLDFSLPFAMPIGDFSLDFGAWYINPTEGSNNSSGAIGPAVGLLPYGPVYNPKRGVPDDELDVYIGTSTTVGPIDVAFGYVHYFLGPEQSGGTGLATGVNDQNELGLTLGTSIGPVDFGMEYAYNFDAGKSKPIFVGPGTPGSVGGFVPGPSNWLFGQYFEPSVGTGFELTDRVSLNLSCAAAWYGNQFSHYQFGLAAPVIIAENVVLEPYVAYMDNNDNARVGGESSFARDTWFGGISLSVAF